MLFADGAYAGAVLKKDPDARLALAVDAYTTLRGAAISARRWLVEQEQLREGWILKILRRV